MKAPKQAKQMKKLDEGNILVVKVGSDERPAGPKDLKAVEEAFNKLDKCEDDNVTLVTHHCIDFVYIPRKNIKKVIVTGHE